MKILRRVRVFGAAVAGMLAMTACGGGGGGAAAGNASTVTLLTTSVPTGTTGVAYTAQFHAAFPNDPGTFAVTSGQLPTGLTLDVTTGAVTGYPRQPGTFRFEIAARDGVDLTLPPGRDAAFAEDRGAFTVTVARGAPHILPQTLPAAQYRAGYAYKVDIAGGTAPYTFSSVPGVDGELPAGLSVGADGTLGSFPTAARQTPYLFRVHVTDAAGLSDTRELSVSVVVLPLVILTSNPLPEGARDFPYVLPLALASPGGGAPFTWSQAPLAGADVDLATVGLRVTTDGRLVDTGAGPTAVGTFPFTVRVEDEAHQLATRALSVKINPGPVLTSISPKSTAVAGPYTVTGLNFQPGAQLVLKPGPGSSTFTPTFVNATTLRFNAPFPMPANAAGPVAVQVVNPDGGSFTKPAAFVFPAATVAFATKGFLASPLSSTGLDVADVNGDGLADLVHAGSAAITAVYNTTTSTSGGLVLHLNLGGAVPTFSTLVLDGGNFTDAKFVDVNADGKLDVVGLGHAAIRTFLGAGDGTFGVGPTSTLPGPGSPMWPSEMTFGRFDGDSLPDVAYGNPSFNYLGYQLPNGRVYSMRGTGTGAFVSLDAALTTINGTYGVLSLQAIDADGDGRSEIAAGYGLSISAGPAVNFTTLTSTGAFTGWSPVGGALNPPLYSSTTGTAVGDFLGLGTPQFAAVTSGSPYYSNYQVFRIYSGAGLGTIATLPAPGSAGKCLAAIDADFDAKTDLLMSCGQSTLLVYRGSSQAIVLTLDAAGLAGPGLAPHGAGGQRRPERRRDGRHRRDDVVLGRQRDGLEPRDDVHDGQHRQRRDPRDRLLPEHVELTRRARRSGAPAPASGTGVPGASRARALASGEPPPGAVRQPPHSAARIARKRW